MLYYKVKPEADQKPAHGTFLIKNELYTPAEKKKHRIKDSAVDPVYISKNKIYFFFGARFYEGHAGGTA